MLIVLGLKRKMKKERKLERITGQEERMEGKCRKEELIAGRKEIWSLRSRKGGNGKSNKRKGVRFQINSGTEGK